MRIGIIQTGAIGDIVIALPIAQWYIRQGHEVFWPVDSRYVGFFREAAPEVNFLSVDVAATGTSNLAYFIAGPQALLEPLGCERVFTLYSFLGNHPLENRHLAHSLKFDEYKYAVAGVPFTEKWNLKLVENHDRQGELLARLDLRGPYVVIHEEGGPGSNFHRAVTLPPALAEGCRVVRIEPVTASPFDWIPVFRAARAIAVVDSLHANLIEQLRIPVRKQLYLRSEVRLTPVFAHGWEFV